jgi:hypothetical protein
MAIPKEMHGKYNEIAAMIVEFCNRKFNDDCKVLCLGLLEKLSPLVIKISCRESCLLLLYLP